MRRLVAGLFQFTLPRGERLAGAHFVDWETQFQFTLPRGERPAERYPTVNELAFQFTLPRGERRMTRARYWALRLVSIHAPAGGATQLLHLDDRGAEVSIHAPAGGATVMTAEGGSPVVFQFTLPRGERPFNADLLYPFLCVSIHAPAGGATGPREREARKRGFQFTLPRGERPHNNAVLNKGLGFNSRSRGGSDMPYNRWGGAAKVSIHAPAGGATRCFGFQGLAADVSIHAPAGGATLVPIFSILSCVFQFTLPRGERLNKLIY